MRKLFLLIGAFFALAPAAQAQMPSPDSVSVAMATVFGDIVRKNLESVRAGGAQLSDTLFAQRFVLALQGKSTGMTMEEANAVMQAVVDNSVTPSAPAEQQQAMLDSARATEGAVVLPSGTVFIVVTEGEGTKPGAHDITNVSYVGRLADGTIFDVTQEPIDLPVDRLVPGFTEGLMQMLPGGTYRLVIPAEAAYGSRGVPGSIPGGSALDFTVTLNSSRPK